ncbi:MAG: T9SS type A sorting domain-containing protein [Ignavibacteriales bacterium]|nr:T9SS type A sorting domain-containing protein [Ignavibacteriales bacterium]
MKYFSHLFFALILSNSLSKAQDSLYWQQTNGPYGGKVNSIAISANGSIFAAVDGGVFRSTNNGNIWILAGLNNRTVNSLSINSSGYIFAGTTNHGVYRSTDNGNKWTQTGITDRTVGSLCTNSNGYIFAGTIYYGIYLSTDNGSSWSQTSLNNMPVNSLSINSSGHIFAATTGYGIYRSTNNGNNWTQVFSSYSTSSLAINASGYVFVGTTYYGIYRSTDNGNNWTQTSLNNVSVNSLSINSSGYIFAGTTGYGIYRSTNNGINWTQTSLNVKSINSLAINVSGHIFTGTLYNGIYQSTNNGDSWTQINNGLLNTPVYSLVKNTSGHMFAGTNGGGVCRSTNNGNSWIQTSLNGLNNVSSLAINSNGYIYSGVDYSGVYLSTNNGDNWSKVLSINGAYNSIAVGPNGDIFVGISENGVYRSTNNGDEWTQTNLKHYTVNSLAVTPNGYIYAAVDGGVFRSTDNGDSWIINSGLATRVARALSINATSGDIFVGTTDGGVYRSRDNGNSWLQTNLNNANIQTILTNSSGSIFAGTPDSGVFLSTDNGNHWTQVNSGLISSCIYSFTVDSGDHIFAGTSNGVFRSTNSTIHLTVAPQIQYVKDVANDQGQRVTIKWIASALDTNVAFLKFYSVWRATPERILHSQKSPIPMKDVNNDFKNPSQKIQKINGTIYCWEWIANQPAHKLRFYAYTAQTLYDSTSANSGKHYFMVSAHTDESNTFFDSNIDSGYSVDNLAPLKPSGFTARYDSHKIVIEWNPNSEPDLRNYLLYNVSYAGFNPDTVLPFIYTTATSYSFQSFQDNIIHLFVRAQDIHENLSPISDVIAIRPTGVVGNDNDKTPTSFSLLQNYPNPFNPTTTFTYTVPRKSNVHLTIFNTLGQTIAELVNEDQEIGYHSVDWKANVSSGIYFYRIEAVSFGKLDNQFVDVKKMVLMR